MVVRVSRRVLAGGLGAVGLWPTAARADGAVDLQLVLAVDTSGSVSAQRFDLQRRGYAAAFRSRDVHQAIGSGRSKAIAVVMTHWTGAALQRVVVDWTRVSDAASAERFADAVDGAPRALFSGGTSISGAIDHAMTLFLTCPFQGTMREPHRRVIDVSGDGENNRGRSPDAARDAAVAAEVNINGLPILAIEPELDGYYRDHVIGGAGSFVIAATGFENFGEAVRRKLVLEIS
jgi:Protein of unknown function (DUF1194)